MELIGEKIGCLRGGRLILKDTSFKVSSGKSLLISGQNGTGKTTLLRIIAGFLQFQTGELSLKGREQTQEDLSIGQCAHYIGHQNAIKNAMSVRENLFFWAEYLGGDSSFSHLEMCLERVGLGHAIEFSASILSAGQKRRLNLARLLVAPRPIWLLDEPSSALDKEGEKILNTMISEHLKKGGMVIASSHENFGVKFNKELKLKKARAAA